MIEEKLLELHCTSVLAPCMMDFVEQKRALPSIERILWQSAISSGRSTCTYFINDFNVARRWFLEDALYPLSVSR